MFHSKAHLSHSGRKKKKKKIYDGTVIEISPEACLAPMKYFSSDSIPSVHLFNILSNCHPQEVPK